jgi:hypothetical protein
MNKLISQSRELATRFTAVMHNSKSAPFHHTGLYRWAAVVFIVSLILPACSQVSLPFELPAVSEPQAATQENVPAEPQTPEAEVTFRVAIPSNTPPGQPVAINIMDEVTGLALNTRTLVMDYEDDQHYTIALRFPVGSVVKYRYSRQTPNAPVEEFTSAGRQTRYRLVQVESPETVEDVVSRWTDTAYQGLSGRITGQVINADSGQSLPNILITAGGAQTLTTSDGTFLIEGLPVGVHNLVAYALDGAFRTFQQGARVAADSTTPATISMNPAPLVNIDFELEVPEGTIPAVPIRLAGNLYQLGNTFADLSGGVSTLASRMPVLNAAPGGGYTLQLQLPAGADVRYLYTQGDGFWNAELTSQGKPHLRQIIVPETDTTINDSVDSWKAGQIGPITFDVYVPQSTPKDDHISIQFKPLYGWTEPIPMWRLGDYRWAYVLNSPLSDLPSLNYRYCRNDQCGLADDQATPGARNSGRSVELTQFPQTLEDQVEAWAWMEESQYIPEQNANIVTREPTFTTGVELQPGFHPSGGPILPISLNDIQSLGANWLIIPSTWTYTRISPPILEYVAGSDPLWSDLREQIEQSEIRGLKVAIFPTASFSMAPEEWWQQAPRDYPWWVVWFERYRSLVLHNADLANRTGAQALILGGDWLEPALPGGVLSDGSPSAVPADAETRWRGLIQEVRSRFSGAIVWALTGDQASLNPPVFLNEVDSIYVLWSQSLSQSPAPSPAELQAEASRKIDNILLPLKIRFGKSITLAVAYPSVSGAAQPCIQDAAGDCLPDSTFFQAAPDSPSLVLDLDTQANIYSALLNAVNGRDWIDGFVTRGYYPAAALLDKSASIHGKPAEKLLRDWYIQLRGPLLE